MEQYLDSRMISDPLCLYDCDVPVDGCIADPWCRGAKLPSTWGVHPCCCTPWAQDEAPTNRARCCGRGSPRLKPRDVDVAEVYDGWSILSLFVARSARFVWFRRGREVRGRRRAHHTGWRIADQHERRAALGGTAARLPANLRSLPAADRPRRRRPSCRRCLRSRWHRWAPTTSRAVCFLRAYDADLHKVRIAVLTPTTAHPHNRSSPQPSGHGATSGPHTHSLNIIETNMRKILHV